ncbi:Somatostatin receptor type 4 [Lamellibrachia satsuma]|nr:Somatostatin receptor type 4 [Lamellibrachia satsuma]
MAALETDSVLDGRWNISRVLARNNESTINTTNDEYENKFIPRNYGQLAYVLIAVLGMMGNAVVIFVILHSASMRRKFTNMLILNQSSIDLVTSVVILITKTLKVSKENLSGVGGDVLCKFWLSELPLWSFMMSSSYNMIALTLERYVGIVYPLRHRTSFSKIDVLLLATAAWLSGPILLTCFMFPTSGVINGRCHYVEIFTIPSWKKVFGVALFIVQYLLPIIVFITCYSRMFIHLRNQVHPQAPDIGHEAVVQNARARRNLLKTLLLVVVGYLLCKSCNQLTFLAYNFGAPLDFSSSYYDFTVVAMFANCCINPFLYALQYRPYQNKLRKVFCNRCVAASTS